MKVVTPLRTKVYKPGYGGRLGDINVDSGDGAFSSGDLSGGWATPDTGATPIDLGAPASGGGSSFNWNSLLSTLGLAAKTSAQVYNSTQAPYVIPGTNLVYNPATGQTTSGVATTATALGTSFLPLLGILAIGAFLLLGNKR